jgi:hypothetical protein
MKKLFVFIIFGILPFIINAQSQNTNIIGSTLSSILSKEGKPTNEAQGGNENILTYESKLFLGYKSEVIFLFYNGYLYSHSYLLEDVAQNEIINVYNSLIDTFIIMYGDAYHIDRIDSNLLSKESPYKAIWNYNGVRIDIKITYQISNQWGLSIQYQVRPEKASGNQKM